MSKIRLAVGIPAYGGEICAEHSKMWLELGHTLAVSHGRFELVMHGYADINGVDRARNWLVAQAMMQNADWLFMVDADTWVTELDGIDPGFQILRMVSEADRMGVSVIGAPVIRRVANSPKREPAVYRVSLENPLTEPKLKHTSIKLDRRDEVDAIGAACMAINLHHVNEANASFRFTDDLSEDLEFCRQMRAWRSERMKHDDSIDPNKGKIICDGRVKTGHLSRRFPLYSGVAM